MCIHTCRSFNLESGRPPAVTLRVCSTCRCICMHMYMCILGCISVHVHHPTRVLDLQVGECQVSSVRVSSVKCQVSKCPVSSV